MCDLEMQSILEIDTFRDKNRHLVSAHGGIIKFRAKVTYQRPGKKDIVEITEVSTDPSGYNPWEIHITETGEIDINVVHADFKPRYQRYKYEPSDNVLTITDLRKSDKSPYKVIIDSN